MTEKMLDEDIVEAHYFSTTELIDSDWYTFCGDINTEIQNLCEDYLWHKEKLEVVFPILRSSDQSTPFLTSSTCFGENIEDEWYIVYVLMKLTAKFQNLIVQVVDSDGAFLIIEAADHLPKWVKPDNIHNRLFIYQSKIHLIPPKIVDLHKQLTTAEAITYVVKHSEDTKVNDDIEKAILKRIGRYPEKIKDDLHRCVVKLPKEIAGVLKLKPSLVSPIVQAYCNHDHLDQTVCNEFEYQDYVDVVITFTKCLYAMLLHSKKIKKIKVPRELDSKQKSSDVGLKMTCGYKIITNNAEPSSLCSKTYTKYLDSLKSKGYFRGNIEGSKDYKTLLESANQFFLSTLCPVNLNARDLISVTLKSNNFSTVCEDLKSNKQLLEEDSDDWLNINPEQLNELLSDRYGKHAKFSNVTPEGLSKDLSNFLYQSSDFEGIETTRDYDENEIIDFNPDEFAESIEKMLHIISSGDAKYDSDSDFSDDGNIQSNGSDTIEEHLEEEIKEFMSTDFEDKCKSSNTILKNIRQSLKEEKSYTGPSSNLLQNIGVHKTDLLDSDDDCQ